MPRASQTFYDNDSSDHELTVHCFCSDKLSCLSQPILHLEIFKAQIPGPQLDSADIKGQKAFVQIMPLKEAFGHKLSTVPFCPCFAPVNKVALVSGMILLPSAAYDERNRTGFELKSWQGLCCSGQRS
jgi:hypothetical protein